ncbi:uncharacterized protein LOC112342092 [Selaginella moellendorffii]|uniref:uncharacterized protein LOC112342092 n=1 Tax=Selaginella moellendorffii TaxID=88036 RepID=UPI000D1CBDFC|nr:uncharacterized protein LOC112342092 [Selaginella moellendorffii]|eukprot:XP_024519127.1 uncharacterized protein LOC112342092 [Selaginella moellendorffii]
MSSSNWYLKSSKLSLSLSSFISCDLLAYFSSSFLCNHVSYLRLCLCVSGRKTNNLTSLRLSWRSSAISACMPPPKWATPSPVHAPNHHHEEATKRERPSDLLSTSLPSRP